MLNELRGVIFRWNGTRGLPFATVSYSRRSWRLTVFDEGGSKDEDLELYLYGLFASAAALVSQPDHGIQITIRLRW